ADAGPIKRSTPEGRGAIPIVGFAGRKNRRGRDDMAPPYRGAITAEPLRGHSRPMLAKTTGVLSSAGEPAPRARRSGCRFSEWGGASGGPTDAGGLDAVIDERVELLEVGLEAAAEVVGGGVIGGLVVPGAARQQHLARHVRAGFRH